MGRRIFADGVLLEEWDDEAQTYRSRDGEQRPYTAEETAQVAVVAEEAV